MAACRILLQFLLLLSLTFGSAGLALAKHQPRAVATVELCTGHGAQSVDIDASGRPTGPRVPCADCLLGLHALPGEAAPCPGMVRALRPACLIVSQPVLRAHRHPALYQPRAPPDMA